MADCSKFADRQCQSFCLRSCCAYVAPHTCYQRKTVPLYHIRSLRHIRKLLSDDVAKTIGLYIACNIVASRFDYCHALLYITELNKLQRAQNNLARVACAVDDRMQGHSSAHFTLPADQTAHRVQDSAHHLQGAEDYEPAVPRRPAGDPSHFTCRTFF